MNSSTRAQINSKQQRTESKAPISIIGFGFMCDASLIPVPNPPASNTVFRVDLLEHIIWIYNNINLMQKSKCLELTAV